MIGCEKILGKLLTGLPNNTVIVRIESRHRVDHESCFMSSHNEYKSQKRICPLSDPFPYFSLEKGGRLDYAIGNKKCHELPLFRENWTRLSYEVKFKLKPTFFK